MLKLISVLLVVVDILAIIWYEEQGKCVQEVSVNGRRLGITAKDLNSPRSRCVTVTNLFGLEIYTYK